MTRIMISRALRLGAPAWRSLAVKSLPIQQQKCFTQATVFRNAAPQVIFDQTGSPELDGVLTEIQNKIILPFHLSAKQRARVHSAKHKDSLKGDPVIIEIDGIEHRFEHIAYDGMPNSRKILIAAVKLMKTREDWANLVRLLVGMTAANRKFQDRDFLTIARLAGHSGQIYSIIDAVRQVKKTGFRLDTAEMVNLVLYFVQIRAAESNWDKEMTQQSLTWTEMLLDQLQEESHKPAQAPPGGFPLYKDPQVLGAPLHLTAALAVKHNDEAARAKCIKYAERIAESWPAGKGLRELYPAEAYEHFTGGVRYLKHSRTEYLATASPIKYGLDLAAQVVEPGLAGHLRSISSALEAELKESLEDQRYPAQRGEYAYKTFFEERPEVKEVEAEEKTE